jgi:hypothetical protein
MAEATKPVTELPTWKGLSAHSQKVGRLHLRELFAQDHKRGERLTAEAAGLYLDYSKNRITDETLSLLLQLADQSGLRARIDAMFAGEKINVSEKRAVLHVALRAPKGQSIVVDGEDVLPQVHSVLDRMADFSNRVRGDAWRGHTGSIKERGGTHATRNDRPRPNGRQYGATTCPTWSPMCRLRHVAERRRGTGEGQRDGKRLAGGFREEARKAARDLVDGSGSSRG